MKLRNKKTGEIEDFEDITRVYKFIGNQNTYSSLAELNDEWEDYEEPKESEYYWYIGYKNDIRRTKYHHISDFADNQVTVTRKEIGNCFESLEEAEKAVEKLKAWKRLKDKGFEFESWFGWSKDISFWIDTEIDENIAKDLDLLFGGEE